MGVFNVSLGFYTRVPGSPCLYTPEGPAAKKEPADDAEWGDEKLAEQFRMSFGGAKEEPVDDSQPRETLEQEFPHMELEEGVDAAATFDPYL